MHLRDAGDADVSPNALGIHRRDDRRQRLAGGPAAVSQFGASGAIAARPLCVRLPHR
jgi:hypothetical protein